jgi:hypothetical protein
MCGKQSISEFIREATNLPWNEINSLIKGISVQRVEEREIIVGKYTEPKGLEPLSFCHREYLILKRSMRPSVLTKLWEIKGITDNNGPLNWRIFIPVIYKGKPVSWTTRSILPDARIRYLSAKLHEEKFPHKHLLYGEDYVRNGVIIHEGPIDVWSTGPGAVCTFGTDYTPAQLLRMTKYPVRVVCFDSKADAQRKALELYRSLLPFPGKTYNVVLDADDAGSASKKEIKSLRKLIR